MQLKECNNCGTPKPLAKFGRTAAGNRENECTACKSTKEREYNKRGMATVTTRCRNGCKGNRGKVKVEVEEGTKIPPMLCADCKEGAPEHRLSAGPAVLSISQFCRVEDHGEVKIYRAGTPDGDVRTPGFDDIAAQVTHIKQCRLAGTLARPGERSVW